MLRIRLSRRGAKKDPHYRVVVSDKKSPRDGKFVEIVGYYNPALKPVRLNLQLDRVDYWLGQGAQPTDTVKALITRFRKTAVDDGSAGDVVSKEAAPAVAAPADAAETVEPAPAEKG